MQTQDESEDIDRVEMKCDNDSSSEQNNDDTNDTSSLGNTATTTNANEILSSENVLSGQGSTSVKNSPIRIDDDDESIPSLQSKVNFDPPHCINANTAENQKELDPDHASAEIPPYIPICNTLPNEPPMHALVEWCGPDESIEEASASNVRNLLHNENAVYIVDPAHTHVVLVVEGIVVPPRHCFVKILGFKLCSDDYPSIVNPKLIPILIVLVCGAVVGIYSWLTRSNVEWRFV